MPQAKGTWPAQLGRACNNARSGGAPKETCDDKLAGMGVEKAIVRKFDGLHDGVAIEVFVASCAVIQLIVLINYHIMVESCVVCVRRVVGRVLGQKGVEARIENGKVEALGGLLLRLRNEFLHFLIRDTARRRGEEKLLLANGFVSGEKYSAVRSFVSNSVATVGCRLRKHAERVQNGSLDESKQSESKVWFVTIGE